MRNISESASDVVRYAAAAMQIKPHCESPIEVMLGAKLLITLQNTFGESVVFCQQGQELKHPNKILLIPQFNWEKYRIDWCIRLPLTHQPYIFVECDGKEFHSSPEQIARDEKRDAEVRAANISVFRYTGSEIFRTDNICVSEVAEYAARFYWNQLMFGRGE